MDMLNRYLAAVGALLPRAERDDILAEVRETLLSEIEARRGAEKRMLTGAEVASLLKTYGHPFAVAALYRSPKPLIRERIYPAYLLALQVMLGAAATAHLIHAAAALALGQAPGAVASFLAGSLWTVSMYLIGVCTFSFVVLERVGAGLARLGAERWLERAWAPDRLPDPSVYIVSADARQRCDLAFVALAYLGAVSAGLWPALPAQWSGGGALWPPAWIVLGQALSAVAGAQVLVLGFGVIRPDWARVRIIADVAVKLAGLGVVVWFAAQRPWLDVAGLPAELAARVGGPLDALIGAGLAALAAAAIIGLAWDLAPLALRAGRALVRAETRLTSPPPAPPAHR